MRESVGGEVIAAGLVADTFGAAAPDRDYPGGRLQPGPLFDVRIGYRSVPLDAPHSVVSFGPLFAYGVQSMDLTTASELSTASRGSLRSAPCRQRDRPMVVSYDEYA